MKSLLLLFLIPFACAGQRDRNAVVGFFARDTTQKTLLLGEPQQTDPFKNGRNKYGVTVIGALTADDVTTGNYSVPLGKRQPAPDTPLADRNPNDFYGDTLTALSGAKYPTRRNIGRENRIKELTEPKQLSLEEKLLLYAEECWKDSTLQRVHVDYYGNWCLFGNTYECTLSSHYIMKYIHRKPTFEHFIEWLKKK